MVLRNGAVALVIALSVISISFFVIDLNISYAKVGDEVCADFDDKKGDKKEGDTVTKSPTKGGVEEGKKAITNSKLETTDDVKVKPDGTVEVKSTCGKEGDTGKVKFCFPGVGGKEMCVSITKKKDEWSDTAKKTSGIEKTLKDAINLERKNYLKEAAKRFIEGGKLPPEYNPLLDELAKGSNPFVCSKSKTACREGAEAALRKLSQENVEGLFGAVLDGDTDAINKGLRDAGRKFGVTDATIRRVSDSLNKGVPGLFEDVCKKVSSDGCGKFTEALKSVTGFTAPAGTITGGSVDTTSSVSKRGFAEVRVPEKIKEKFLSITGLSSGEIRDIARKYRIPEKYINSLVDEGKVAGIASLESGLNPRARAKKSTATGLFQFLKGTSAAIGVPHGAQVDPKVSMESFFKYLGQNYYNNGAGPYMDAAVGVGLDPAIAAYIPHNLGAGGGRSFLSAYARNPNARVSSAVSGTAIRNNPGLYGNGTITLRQATENMAAKISNGRASSFAGAGANRYSGNSPFGASAGGIGNALKGLFGGGGGAKKSGGGSSGGGSSTKQPAPRSTSVSQPLPPAKPPTSKTQTDQPKQTSEPIRPTLSLIAHPSTAQKGDSLNIIWSAVGVSDTQKCRLNVESLEAQGTLAEGNKGTEVIQVPVSTQLTELRFTLLCVPRDTRISPEDARTGIIVRIK